jgi:ribosomal protein S18 acetylase RimI-like enzyme
MKFQKDKFITKLLGINSFISNKVQNISSLKKPFFLTIKKNKKIKEKVLKTNKIKFKSILVIFYKKIISKSTINNYCRFANPKDKKQILDISNEKTSNSRLAQDKSLSLKFRNNYRKVWVENFFKGKRGNFLVVAHKKNIIMGFLLLIEKKSELQIDLIVTKKSYQKKGVAASMINYANNVFLGSKIKEIVAGTQLNNIGAIKFYKKLDFKKRKIQYVYHLHKK